VTQPRRQPPKRGTLAAVVFSLAAHVLIVAALLAAHASPPKEPDTTPMTASLVDGKILASAVSPPAPAQPAPAQSPPRKTIARPARTPRAIDPLPEDDEPEEEAPPQLSDAQLAGAMTADSGPAGAADSGPKGHNCNMARLLQSALRKDPLVQGAVAGTAGKPIMVWNGDWVRSSSQDGKGLAAVREAITWEIGFAPEACRVAPVHGLVLISLNDRPGAARLVVGSRDWRWSDLLLLRTAPSSLR
jgi:hypothetical protein